MILSEQEKAAHLAAFKNMSPSKKLEHVFTYYKLPIFLILLACVVLGSVIHRSLTHKQPLLHLALVNVSVSDDTKKLLTSDFLTYADADPKKNEVYLYQNLYLSENADTLNHEYAYASKMKVTGAISAKQMDLVLMNREGYDIFSNNGYLLDLSESLSRYDGDFSTAMEQLLTENKVVISDNSLEVMLGVADEEQIITESVQNAINVSALPIFKTAAFDGDVYLGIIANSDRTDTALQYIGYLFSS